MTSSHSITAIRSRAITIDPRGIPVIHSDDLADVIRAATYLLGDYRLEDDTLAELRDIRDSRLASLGLISH